jgi:arsenate reductase
MVSAPIRIYHNARCSKSRGACELIAESGIQVEIVNYLETPPTRTELVDLLRKLGMKPSDLLRRGEPVFMERYAGRDLSEEDCIEAMLAHPILMERPIVVRGDRAVVARPPERVKELF